jgi:hypothetical protein
MAAELEDSRARRDGDVSRGPYGLDSVASQDHRVVGPGGGSAPVDQLYVGDRDEAGGDGDE